jgi:CBS domain-containing protein
MMEQYSLWDRPIGSLCLTAAKEKVKEIMYTPTEGEYIEEDVSMDAAIHRLVLGHHHSLLVTRGRDIVGILRLTDVFSLISQKLLELQC